MNKKVERNLTVEKIEAFTEAANEIGCNPLHLMAVISFETGRSFSEKARNPHSSASGLIQFMASTAKNLGTDIETVRAMSFSDQLQLVVRYFELVLPGGSSGLADLYMAVLWPRAIGKPMKYKLFRSPSRNYKANAGLDRDDKGFVTKADCLYYIIQHLQNVAEVCAYRGY